VMEKRNALKVWSILLAVLAFSLSLIGTFLVRSGVLTSVHAFANDPRRGVFILVILVLFIGGSLVLFAWRAPLIRRGGLFSPISREGALVLNNLFLICACATVFVGTLYPLILEAITGEKISVGAPFFNATFGPLFLPVLIAVPFGPLLAWKRGDLLGVSQRLLGAFAIAVLAMAGVLAVQHGGPILAPFAIGLAFFVIAGAATAIVERAGFLQLPFATALARAKGLPRSAWGTALAHLALGVTLLGIIGETQWGVEHIEQVKPGQTIALAGYDLAFDGLSTRSGSNYQDLVAHFTVRRNGQLIGVMEPAKRSFPSRSTTVNESALLTRGFSQLYLAIGDVDASRGTAVRLYYKPLVLLIWLGALTMALGGALSLSDRRLRVGAPMPARARTALAPAE
jgi:cytochrome c-type biogenesis protein CcmF